MDDAQSLLWGKYKHDVELHRSYLDLVIKINAFYYAVTGAIVSFCFLHFDDEPLVRFSLVLPFFMSLFLAVFFGKSAEASKPSQQEIERLAKLLEFEVCSVVASVLEFLLRLFFLLFILSACGLFLLFLKGCLF